MQLNPAIAIAFGLNLFSLAGIPPFLGFFSKLFVINSLVYSNIYIAILAIMLSVVSCVRYLNLVQLSSFKNVSGPLRGSVLKIDSIRSYLLSILTLLLTLSFLQPVYLISCVAA